MTASVAIACAMLIALTLYVLLGGADYGAGVWDLLATGPRASAQRDLIAKAIGPVWEANHVWLILVVVLLFSAFPPAFSLVMTTLHVPISIMLVGIVLRGSAFTFRAYDSNPRARRRWGRAFAIPSVVTPVMLGAIVGSIAQGCLSKQPNQAAKLGVWLCGFPLTVGLFALVIFAYLAAVYLTVEAEKTDLREIFRRKALVASVVVGLVAHRVYVLALTESPLIVRGLGETRWGQIILLATGGAAIAVMAALWWQRFQIARIAAITQVTLILWGWALAQYPLLVPPELTIQASAAPVEVLRLLLIALAAGSLLLFPSLYLMWRIFKRNTLSPLTGSHRQTEA